MTKGLWGKIKTGRSHSRYSQRQNIFSLGKLISFIDNQKSELDNEK